MNNLMFTVRTFHVLERAGVYIETPEQAIAFADKIVAGQVRYSFNSTATELYRAGGLGIYPIYKRLGGKKTVQEIRRKCEFYDRYLHNV